MLAVFEAKKDYKSLKHAIKICRSITTKLWDNSKNILSQVQGLGIQYTKLLSQSKITNFAALGNMDPSRIEMVIRNIIRLYQEILRLELK
jgi:hypothetical protein